MSLIDFDPALTTLATVKVQLKEAGTAEDTRLAQIILQASAEISSYCARAFHQETVTEYHSGNDKPSLWLRRWPVTTPLVGSCGIWLDGAGSFTATTLLTERTSSVSGDYVVHGDEDDKGRVTLLGGTWPHGVRNIKVVYEGGYATIPQDLQAIATEYTIRLFKLAQRPSHQIYQSVTGPAGVGGTLQSPDPRGLPSDLKKRLDRWRRILYH